MPRSRTIGGPDPVSTATHGVLPPYLWCRTLEHGQDPRTPKNLTRSGLPLRDVNGDRHYPATVVFPTPDLEKRIVTAGGIEFGVLEAGPESGQLALCLHGFPDSAWTWRHLLPALAEAGYHAVAPFLGGYAPTGLAPDGSYQTGELATDACALDEVLGGDSKSILIGHDWGSLAAYGAAGLRSECIVVERMSLPASREAR